MLKKYQILKNYKTYYYRQAEYEIFLIKVKHLLYTKYARHMTYTYNYKCL